MIRLDIEVYEDCETEKIPGAQAKYCYHGTDDVYWCDSIGDLMLVIKDDLEAHEED